MANYCLVKDGVIHQGPCALPRVYANISNFPALSGAQKLAHGWYPVVDTRPPHNPTTQTETGPVNTVMADHVMAVWTVQDRDLAVVQSELVAKVKADAGEKILSVLPRWKQNNLNAEANELNHKRIVGGSLSAEEQASLTSLLAMWGWVKDVRGYSNTLEAGINAAATPADALLVYESAVWP